MESYFNYLTTKNKPSNNLKNESFQKQLDFRYCFTYLLLFLDQLDECSPCGPSTQKTKAQFQFDECNFVKIPNFPRHCSIFCCFGAAAVALDLSYKE